MSAQCCQSIATDAGSSGLPPIHVPGTPSGRPVNHLRQLRTTRRGDYAVDTETVSGEGRSPIAIENSTLLVCSVGRSSGGDFLSNLGSERQTLAHIELRVD